MNYSLDTLADQIKATSGLPVGVGFGVSSAEQVEKIAEYADAVIVGSAIVRIIEQYGSNKDSLLEELSKFINGLSGACNKPELKMKEKAQ
jgi:tryptophan synthase alpha chain